MEIFHFSGAGNDFVVIDGRGAEVSAFREAPHIGALCREFGTDGLIILGSGDNEADFSMEFYNPDGSGGMVCGNGGRCVVAFADYLGIRPSSGGVFLFRAPDGLHVRTYEKGVEGETLACGTGLTASAIAAYVAANPCGAKGSIRLRARQDWLSVDFTPGADGKFTDIYLTGPARLVEIR